jgi:hypothetical protein
MSHADAAPNFSTLDTRSTMEVFSWLAELWGLSTDQQLKLLGSPARSTMFKWKKEGGLIPEDTRERISHLVNINKCLRIIMPNPSVAHEWLFKPNDYFRGQTALDRMLEGKMSNIYEVRQYLDAQRGG